MMKNLSIRFKLLFSFLVIVIFTIVVGYYSTTGIKRNDEVFRRVLNLNANIRTLLEMKSTAYDIDRESLSFKTLGQTSTQSDTSSGAANKFRILAALERLEKWENEYRKYADPNDPKDRIFIEAVDSGKAAIIETTLAYIEINEKGTDRVELLRLEQELAVHIEKLKSVIDAAVIEDQKNLIAAEVAANNQSKLIQRVSTGISIITVLAALALTYLLTRGIDRPLRIVRDAAFRIAGGDLSTRISLNGKDEIGELASVVNQMTASLEKTQAILEDNAKESKNKALELKEQVNETEKTKKAVLNLLEDTRAAEAKEAEQALELKKVLEKVKIFAAAADKERNMYLLLLSSIGEGVLVLDSERKITVMNRVAERTLEHKAVEVVGKNFNDVVKFIHANKEPLEETFWDEAFKSKLSITPANDLSIIGKEGETIPIFIIVAPIIDPTTQASQGVIITFRDVRQERALEEARIGFISTASHQLRTPLTSMRWFSEMLLAGDAGAINDEQKHFVDRIYQGTDRMIALVNLLLQLARVEAGRVKVEPVPVDMKTLTEGVILTTKVNFDTKKQKIEINTNPNPLPMIPMDQDMLWQVVQNLLSNANRYAPSESTIFVEIVEKGEEIEYAVRDTGIGIPKDQQSRLFEKFFRADNAVSAVPEGSGLGLSLVKILVEGWGGRIWFESEQNKGTTFHFTVPIHGMKAKEGEVKLTV